MFATLLLFVCTVQVPPVEQPPQRQAATDEFTVRVLEADGSPSVGRRVTAILEGGLAANSSIDYASEKEVDVQAVFYAERTNEEGIYQFDRGETLETARRFVGHTKGEIWVSGTLGIVKQVSVDYASQREVIIRLPETTQLLVKLPPEVPKTVFLQVADAEDTTVYVCGGPAGRTADPLGDGWYRIDPIPLDQHLEMRVYRLSNRILASSSPLSGMAMIPLKNVRGPTEEGEHKRVELEWMEAPIFQGRFVDAQGQPFEFHQTTSYNFKAYAFAEGQKQAVTEVTVEGFEDGTFFALPHQHEGQESFPTFDRIQVQWTPPEPEILEHLKDFYAVEERLETGRSAVWQVSDPEQRGLIALGDIELDAADSLIEFTVTDTDGKPIQYATIEIEAHLPREHFQNWVGISQRALRTNREGHAHYAAPDWRSAIFESRSEEGWEDALPRLTVHVDAEGYVRKRVEFNREMKQLTVVLDRERVLEGRVHASMLDRLEQYSRQLQVYAVEPGGNVDWKEDLWSKPIPRETSWSKDHWMSFRLAGLPAERFDLVFRIAHQDFEIARLRNVLFEELEQPFELDLDGYVDFVQLTLLDTSGIPVRPRGETRVSAVCQFLPRYYNNPFHFAQWHDEYWWLPISREKSGLQAMDLEVKGFRPVRLEGIAAGELTLYLERLPEDESGRD